MRCVDKDIGQLTSILGQRKHQITSRWFSPSSLSL